MPIELKNVIAYKYVPQLDDEPPATHLWDRKPETWMKMFLGQLRQYSESWYFLLNLNESVVRRRIEWDDIRFRNSCNASSELNFRSKQYKLSHFPIVFANAPKLGDKEAWSARLAQGWSVLIDHAINGYKGMPAKGGRADLSDDQVTASVGFMLSNVK